MVRILVADDHPLIRSAIRQSLLDESLAADVGEAASGQETMEKLRASTWNLLILDINMPDRSGLDILKYVQAGFPSTRVLVVSAFPERQFAVNALRAGASGYLQKDAAADDLMKAVQCVLAGRRYVSPTLAEVLLNELDDRSDQPIHTQLSEREFQIFCKLAKGMAVSDIARELFLSVKTVSTYRSRVLEKLNFKSNADMTTYALRNELIQ